MRITTLLAFLISLAVGSVNASAAIVQFDLIGVAGAGLLPGNERPTAVFGTGSGGEIGPNGIRFDDVSKILLINVGWGSGQGFADLTGAVTLAHIHSAGVGGGILGFGSVVQDIFAGITSNTPSNGILSFSTPALSAANETRLLAGDLYLNFHTAANGGGEIRGNLVPAAVPEPASTAALVVLATGAIVHHRRKRLKAK